MTDLHAESVKDYPIADLCKLVGVSKQAYYQYDEDIALAKVAKEEFALQYIKDIRSIDPGIGGVKLWYMYKHEFGCDESIGRDRFCRILDEHGLKVRLKLRKPRTTDSTHGLPTYPNLIKNYIPLAANQLWVSDITYIMIMDDDYHYHFCYLSMILDAFTEEIVGWSVGPTLDTTYPIAALQMAIKRVDGNNANLIHHSDRGCQYASREYVNKLKERGIQISMTESGDPKDNAQAERINNTMKNELLKNKVFTTIQDVIASVAIAVDFYNNRRPHMSIGMKTPAEMVRCVGEKDMKWHSYRYNAIKYVNEFYIPENSLPLQSGQEPPS